MIWCFIIAVILIALVIIFYPKKKSRNRYMISYGKPQKSNSYYSGNNRNDDISPQVYIPIDDSHHINNESVDHNYHADTPTQDFDGFGGGSFGGGGADGSWDAGNDCGGDGGGDGGGD